MVTFDADGRCVVSFEMQHPRLGGRLAVHLTLSAFLAYAKAAKDWEEFKVLVYSDVDRNKIGGPKQKVAAA